MVKGKNRSNIRRTDEMPCKGVIILTGPSSCGKGAISEVIAYSFGIKGANVLSMGQVLRDTYTKANMDNEFASLLQKKYFLSSDSHSLKQSGIYPEVKEKVLENYIELNAMIIEKYVLNADTYDAWEVASEIDWLEFCTTRGLLVPDVWTKSLIKSYLDENIENSNDLFLIDGYPRTTEAAVHLLDSLEATNTQIIKVLHLSISQQEMMKRAGLRNRVDDTPGALKKRFDFYTSQIQPSVDYLKERLGYQKVSLVDAHQPFYDKNGGFQINESIQNVAFDCFMGLGVSRKLAVKLIGDYSSKDIVLEAGDNSKHDL